MMEQPTNEVRDREFCALMDLIGGDVVAMCDSERIGLIELGGLMKLTGFLHISVWPVVKRFDVKLYILGSYVPLVMYAGFDSYEDLAGQFMEHEGIKELLKFKGGLKEFL